MKKTFILIFSISRYLVFTLLADLLFIIVTTALKFLYPEDIMSLDNIYHPFHPNTWSATKNMTFEKFYGIVITFHYLKLSLISNS